MIIERNDELHIGGISVTELVKKYGEPLYIYDAEVMERQYAKLREALPDEVEVFYSMKANPNISIVAWMRNLVQGLDVSSLNEMIAAQEAGCSPDRILFVGPSKSEQEIREAVLRQIFCLVVESEHELELVDRIAGELDRTASVALRINPAFDAGGSKLKMGGGPRQFGMDEEGIESVFRKALTMRHVNLLGMHVYLGTRILDCDVAWKNTRYALELGQRLQETSGSSFGVIDFGGGLGVPYFPGESEFDIEQFGRQFREFFAEYKRAAPGVRLIMESGRYLTADAGVYVTQVRYVKRSRGQRFVLVGGGLNHHQATTSIGSLIKNHFPIEVVNRMTAPKEEEAQICGPLCTPTDVIGKSVKLCDVEPGDLIGIMKSGAYGPTASPVDFLSHSHPAEVMVYKGRDFLIRHRTSAIDLLQRQVLVDPAAVSEYEPARYATFNVG